MLLSATITNYRSFWKETSLCLASPQDATAALDTYRYSPASTLRVPKLSFIYGPNASGKSNLLRAISVMQFFLNKNDSFSRTLARETRESYHICRASAHAKPSQVRVQFLCEQKIYEYSLEFLGDCIHSEYLLEKDARANSFHCIYTYSPGRGLTIPIVPDDVLRDEIINRMPEKGLSQTCLYFFVHREELHGALGDWLQRLGDIHNFLSNNLLYISADRGSAPNPTIGFFEDSPERALCLTKLLLAGSDSGVQIQEEAEAKSDPFILPCYGEERVLANHPVQWDALSNGSRRLLNLAALLADLLHSGGVLLWDEVEQSLHPILVQQLLHAISSRSFRRPVQIICTSHSPCFMSMARPESTASWLEAAQIHLVAKDAFGQSRSRRLDDILENNPEEQRGASPSWAMTYLEGLYGAYPQLDLDDFVRAAAADNLAEGEESWQG